eukprot:TRINITY_DN3957_c0_g1_i1.p1 TRINITY_DN3957_c0_g1~~TRINITY_DN3957_c0_g1_i1.p1  ORF type:complete len:410 (-),score=87.14 TRINITY_DN3957_c0_g1_i1:33-1262(-)
MTTTIKNPHITLIPLQEALSTDSERKILLFSVTSRKSELFLPPSPTDFTLKAEYCLEKGEEGVIKIVHNPNITLYCFDFTLRRALFVLTSSARDIYTAPFLYLAQLAYATHVYSVPIELLEEVLLTSTATSATSATSSTSSTSTWYKESNTSLRSEDQIIFLFSTGRCGSTLLCKVMGKIKGVLGLQEPEPFTSLTGLRNAGGATDEDIVKLLRLIVVCHCKPEIHHHANIQKWIFKFQSQVTEYLDLFASAFPTSSRIFMYRNAEGVTKSIGRMMPDLNVEIDPLDHNTALFSGLKWISRDKKYNKDFVAIYWLTTVEKTLKFIRSGIKITSVRYEELVAQTEKTVRKLAEICKIKVDDDDIQNALDAMKTPSQEGTFTVYDHQGYIFTEIWPTKKTKCVSILVYSVI